MKTAFIIRVSLLLSCCAFLWSMPKENIVPNQFSASAQINHSDIHMPWSALLQLHVSEQGAVNYSSFLKNKSDVEAYLEILNKNKPNTTWTKNETLAFYINMYNAGTVLLVLNNYPVQSIKDINTPWDTPFLKLNEQPISLGEIEHEVLRKMNEPRIHFAINCASFSCPKLVNNAFMASTLERQLEKATKDFVNDSSKNNLTGEVLQLSKIFKWYKNDFTEDGDILSFLQKYSTTPISGNASIRYNSYNWDLNE